MKKTGFWLACVSILILCPLSRAAETTVSSHGWTITVDPDRAELTLSQQALGRVLQNLSLEFSSGGTVLRSHQWTAQALNDHTLSIHTQSPNATWVFTLSTDVVRISTTSAEALIEAQAPASPQRMVARLLDPEGTPVDWVGTGEVAGGYGGSYTHNRSYLPRRNPEVAYFALGQTSASGLHALFDRPTDIAIQFAQRASFVRNAHDQNLLDARIPVPGNTAIKIIPDYFTKTLGVPFYVPFDDSHFPTAPMVWSSWTSYYEGVKESDITLNADWIAKHLRPYGFEFVQLDDGYDRGPHGEHYWISRWDKKKFPHGPKWLADYIRSKGLRAGIWLVPNSQAAFVTEHPDWYVYYKNGKMVEDYSTPALDSTNPGVLKLLDHEFTTIKDWGYDYYKLDGEFAIPKYVPHVDLSRLYNATIDPVVAYRNRMKVIHNAIGQDSFIEECVAGTPLNATGYADSFFNGDDLYDNWQGMYSLFSSINANTFFNHIIGYNMPGEGMALEPHMSFEECAKKRNPIVLETMKSRELPLTGCGTTLAEARTVVSYVALTGVEYSMGSIMPELPEQRINLLHKTLPTMPIFPIDLFSRGTQTSWDKFKHTTPDTFIHDYPEILDLKVNTAAGVYDVVAMTNWRSWNDKRKLLFRDELGLDKNAKYVAFDFWNEKLYGVFQGNLTADLSPHDTRVFALHPLTGHPQLVGISRHITGAYSVLNLHWDASVNTLAGNSKGIAGKPYTLYIYMPSNYRVSGTTAQVDDHSISATRVEQGRLLAVTFNGQEKPVQWKVTFSQR